MEKLWNKVLKGSYKKSFPQLRPKISTSVSCTEITNRLVYNFILDLNNDSILCNKKFKGGKLWTFQQIEHNLHRNFFSSCFEREYEHTKEIIYTREKYKEF